MPKHIYLPSELVSLKCLKVKEDLQLFFFPVAGVSQVQDLLSSRRNIIPKVQRQQPSSL